MVLNVYAHQELSLFLNRSPLQMLVSSNVFFFHFRYFSCKYFCRVVAICLFNELYYFYSVHCPEEKYFVCMYHFHTTSCNALWIRISIFFFTQLMKLLANASAIFVLMAEPYTFEEIFSSDLERVVLAIVPVNNGVRMHAGRLLTYTVWYALYTAWISLACMAWRFKPFFNQFEYWQSRVNERRSRKEQLSLPGSSRLWGLLSLGFPPLWYLRTPKNFPRKDFFKTLTAGRK